MVRTNIPKSKSSKFCAVSLMKETFQQFVADLLGMEIGGIATLQLFNDLIYINTDQYLRNCFLCGYFSSRRDVLSELINAEVQILESRKRFYNVSNLDWNGIKQLGLQLGSNFGRLSQNFVNNDNRKELGILPMRLPIMT